MKGKESCPQQRRNLSDRQFERMKAQNKYILKEPSQEKLQENLNRKLEKHGKTHCWSKGISK